MTKPITKTIIVLDKSGSMKKRRQQAIDGYNEQVQQAKLNSQEQDIFCSLITFNAEVTEHLWNVRADQLQEATLEDYDPMGGTAMRDAVGYAIEKCLAEEDYKNPNVSYLLLAITDGESNADKVFGRGEQALPRYRELIDSVQSSGRWTISFMGCSARYLESVSRETGVAKSNMAAFSAASAEEYAYANRQAAARTNHYYQARKRGVAQVSNMMCDTDGQVANFVQGGELPIHIQAATPAEAEQFLANVTSAFKANKSRKIVQGKQPRGAGSRKLSPDVAEFYRRHGFISNSILDDMPRFHND